ncbi:hypothetical protein QUF80_03850 [Desulfococcaceae bacterium HSG8]|nr:hypothetical protein [Desulfococcaceae bacterium HSG8]
MNFKAKQNCIFLILVAALSVIISGNVMAGEVSLYDGSENTTPDEQGWLSNFSISELCNYCELCVSPFCPSNISEACNSSEVEDLCKLSPASSSQEAAEGVTSLDSMTDTGDLAGYFSNIPDLSSFASIPGDISFAHPDMPGSLDRSSGFTITFEAQVLEEEHDYNDRAGFSVIVNTHDCSGEGCMGLELGFWTDQIWTQGDADDEDGLFRRSETASFDTTIMTRYDLTVKDDNYELFANNSSVLKGRLRNYTTYEDPFYVTIYQTPDFLFFGDDTESAKAKVRLGSVTFRDSKGDINGDGIIRTDDAITGLQICAGEPPSGIAADYTPSDADVNNDKKIGSEEVIYILLSLSETE